MQTFQIKITGSCFLCRHQDCTILISNLCPAGVQECQQAQSTHPEKPSWCWATSKHPETASCGPRRARSHAEHPHPADRHHCHPLQCAALTAPSNIAVRYGGFWPQTASSWGMLFHHGLCHLSIHKQSSLLLSQSAGFMLCADSAGTAWLF